MSTAIAWIINRTDANRASFIEHYYLHLWHWSRRTSRSCSPSRKALIEYPERTLNAAEIVIALTLACQVFADEQERGAAWRQVTERVAEIDT
jgi:hypothetical protein